MAIGIRIKLPGVTQEQFDAAQAHINPDRSVPQGMLFHGSGPIDGGWGVIDFWESRADFDAFQVRIQEGIAASGVEMQGPPDIKEFPVHEIIQPLAIRCTAGGASSTRSCPTPCGSRRASAFRTDRLGSGDIPQRSAESAVARSNVMLVSSRAGGGSMSAEVQDLAVRYGAAWGNRDVDAIMGMHTEDTVYHLHGGAAPAVGPYRPSAGPCGVAVPPAGSNRAAVRLSAGKRGAHAAPGRSRPGKQTPSPRCDARRRRGGGVRQGSAPPRPRLPRRRRDRPDRARG